LSEEAEARRLDMTIGQFSEALKVDRSVTVAGVRLSLPQDLALAAAETLAHARPKDEPVLAIVGAAHRWYLATPAHVVQLSVETTAASETPHQVTLISWSRRAITRLQVETHYTSQPQGRGRTVFLRTADVTCEGPVVTLTLKSEDLAGGETARPEHVLQFAMALTEP
jgi:hypothetical protein